MGASDGITPALVRNQVRRDTEGQTCAFPDAIGDHSAQWTRRTISAIFGVVTHLRNARRAAIALALVGCLATGCARPYAGPKTLATIAAALLVGGGTTWVVGERQNHNGTANLGLVTTVIGVGAAIGAAGWLAGSVACEEDPDCPRGEECKEIPALPGRVPYKQCMRRPGP